MRTAWIGGIKRRNNEASFGAGLSIGFLPDDKNKRFTRYPNIFLKPAPT
jgi:hypothetical protein